MGRGHAAEISEQKAFADPPRIVLAGCIGVAERGKVGSASAHPLEVSGHGKLGRHIVSNSTARLSRECHNMLNRQQRLRHNMW